MKRRVFLALAPGMALLPRFVSIQSGWAVPKGTEMDAIARDRTCRMQAIPKAMSQLRPSPITIVLSTK